MDWPERKNLEKMYRESLEKSLQKIRDAKRQGMKTHALGEGGPAADLKEVEGNFAAVREKNYVAPGTGLTQLQETDKHSQSLEEWLWDDSSEARDRQQKEEKLAVVTEKIAEMNLPTTPSNAIEEKKERKSGNRIVAGGESGYGGSVITKGPPPKEKTVDVVEAKKKSLITAVEVVRSSPKETDEKKVKGAVDKPVIVMEKDLDDGWVVPPIGHEEAQRKELERRWAGIRSKSPPPEPQPEPVPSPPSWQERKPKQNLLTFAETSGGESRKDTEVKMFDPATFRLPFCFLRLEEKEEDRFVAKDFDDIERMRKKMNAEIRALRIAKGLEVKEVESDSDEEDE